MQRLPQRLSKAINRVVEADDPTLPAILEFQSPSAAIIATPIPRSARGLVWVIASMFAAGLLAMGLIHVDRVVSAAARVVSKASTIVVQPLETAIVRSIDVREGESVHAGDLLARLDPTFANADADALAAQVSSLQAEVTRLQAEADEKPFSYSGLDPSLALQAAIYAQRQAERSFKLENYRQKIDGLKAIAARAAGDQAAYRDRLVVAQDVETMRKSLEKLQVGSRLNSLAATDNRLEIARGLATAIETGESAKRDLGAMIAERDGYVQNWRAQASQTLSEEIRKLSDARESLNKAQLRHKLVELRADRDATVLTLAKVSVGSVLQSGEQLITLVPGDAPLEIEANIAGSDDGFVHVGDPVAIKFDTFPFSQYGMATGTVRVVSADSFTAADQQYSRSPSAVPLSSNSNQPYYRARIAIDQVALHGVPENFHVTPGMPVTADIKVGKHTILSYLLGRVLPVAQEGMREP
jgi:HlyD family secretion protein